MIDMIGGRKFLFALIALIMGFWLVLVDKMTSAQFSDFAIYIGGIYVIGNVAGVITGAVSDANTKKPDSSKVTTVISEVTAAKIEPTK